MMRQQRDSIQLLICGMNKYKNLSFYFYYPQQIKRSMGQQFDLINQQIIQMQQQSSNHSEHSNLFALSSQSSRLSHTQKRKKQHYSSFITKVKHLLQAEGDDLDELYRKVQIIVHKYFNQHKIVEFSDMYDHIAALKTNSGKMNIVVGLLQRRLAQQYRQQQGTNRKKSTRREYETQTNSKQLQTKVDKKHKQTKQQQTLKQFKQSVANVISSVEQHQRPTNSFHKSEAMTTNMSDDHNNWHHHNRNNIKREESPTRYSPDRLNSSFEQYQSRNRQYEQKVRQLLSELSQIKRDISHGSTRQVQERVKQQQYVNIKEELKLKLQQNRQNELRSETSLIDALQKNIMKQTNLTQQNQHQNRDNVVEMKKLQSIKQKSNQSIASHKTVGSNKQLIQQPQQPTQTASSNKQIDILAGSKQQYQSLSVEEKKQLVLEQANNITNQLKQLKAVAAQLHKHNNNQQNTQQQHSRPRSQYSQVSEISNNIFATIQNNNNQILDKISPTTSKPIIESAIPSFKYVQQLQPINRQLQGIINKNSVHMIESSAFSFSDNATHPPINSRPITKSNYLVLNNQQYARSGSRENMRSNGTAMPIANNQMYHTSQPIETIKYIYNPYGNVAQQPIRNPSVHFSHQQSGRLVSQSFKQIAVPSMHNNSSTSIMRNTLAPHIQPNRQPIQPIQSNSSNRIRFDNGRYSHLKQGNSRSSVNIEQSQVHAVNNNYSMVVGGGGLRRKGINMLSPNNRSFLRR